MQAAFGLLGWEEAQVGEVDGRDDERDEGVAAVVLGVGEGGESSGYEGGFWRALGWKRGCSRRRTDFACDVAVEAGEDDVAVVKLFRMTAADDKVAQGL